MIARYNNALQCGIDPNTLNSLTLAQTFWLDYQAPRMGYREALAAARAAKALADNAAADPT